MPDDTNFIKRHIRESNLIENIDDPVEDKQSLVAWEYLQEQSSLGHGVIGKVQKIITLHQTNLMPNQRGYYRSLSGANVYIGGKLAPSPHIVESLMANWILDYGRGASNPIEAHVQFEHAHPFVDGNGRTGRMLLLWHELKNNQKPTLFLASEKYEKYYPLFK